MTDNTATVSARATVPAKPAPVLFDHGNKRVFILVPYDEIEARHVLDEIEHLVLPLQEAGRPLKIVNDLRIGLLGENQFLYTAVTKTKRVVKDRKVTTETSVVISDPIDCGKFSVESAEDGLGTVNIGLLMDAAQKFAFPFVLRKSADTEVAKVKVKLLGT